MFQIGIIGRGIQGGVTGVYLRERDPEVVVRSRVEAPNPGTVN
jgi:glycine/D-amino acid oxidase-like deaminating enzyme